VAPADPERRAVLTDFAPVPFARLPYRSIVVGSSNDPYCPVRLAGAYARAWGSEFVRLQGAGHINVESGHGEWPLGLALLQSLAGCLFLGQPVHFSSSSSFWKPHDSMTSRKLKIADRYFGFRCQRHRLCTDPAQRLVRRGARVLQGLQRRLCRALQEDHRQGHQGRPVAWRLQRQARAVNDGLDADVVTMNTTTDVDFLAGTGMVAKDWAKKFPGNASPTTSTMLFLVRNGNPKGIKDWDDLVKPGVQVVVVNPKTGGNGRMAYLAAWGYVRKKGGTDAQAAEFVASCTRTCRCWPRAAAMPRASSCSAISATCWSPSSRRCCRSTGVRRRQGRRDPPVDQHRGREPGGGGRAHHVNNRKGTAELARPTCSTCIPRKARKSPRSTRCAHAQPPC
jgi:hypothetical protein